MIGLEVEQALAKWIGFVGDPEAGELSYRHGDSRVSVPIRFGVDDRERPVPSVVCADLDGTWESDFPAAGFRGIAAVSFLYGADPSPEVTGPAEEALRLARVIDQALHRPDLTLELTEASGGRLHFSGFTSGIQHSVATENRHWMHAWVLPLYVVQLDLSLSQEIEPCLS